MYEIKSDTVLWKGKAIKGANAAAFKVLAPIIGHDGARVYVLSKPFAAADAGTFEVLSAGYAKDAKTVFEILASKLKPAKKIDAATFVALNECYGRAGDNIYFRGKSVRLRKGTKAEDFRALGHVYASDGETFFYATERFEPPADLDLGAPELRLKWFSDNEINRPPLAVTDGKMCWVTTTAYETPWAICQGADFETLAPLAGIETLGQDSRYFLDKTHIWFEGTVLDDIAPKDARRFGSEMVTDGTQLWCGAAQIEARLKDSSYISSDYVIREPEYCSGDLVHHGDRLVLYSSSYGHHMIQSRANTPSDAPADILNAALGDMFQTMFEVFSNVLPMVTSLHDIAKWLSENQSKLPDCPAFKAALLTSGEVELTLEDGTVLTEPVSCWYTLGCHFWCHVQGRPLSVLPYPALGTMSPESIAMHRCLIRQNSKAMRWLTGLVFEQGHETEARLLAHMCFYLDQRYRDLEDEDMNQLVWLPRELMDEFSYWPVHHDFSASTNLAVSRLIIKDNWLEAENLKDRLDVISVLHAAVLDTNQTKIFFKEIIPVVMARYLKETCMAVREQLAMVLDAALVRGQVDCEVSQQFHHKAMLPVIEFCIAHGINTLFNRARFAECLWALDRDNEGDAAAEALIADFGEDQPLPGVYCNRHTYRTPRLWFLRGKVDVAYRKGSDAEHRARLSGLEADYKALASRYGKEMNAWPEAQDILENITRYGDSVGSF